MPITILLQLPAKGSGLDTLSVRMQIYIKNRCDFFLFSVKLVGCFWCEMAKDPWDSIEFDRNSKQEGYINSTFEAVCTQMDITSFR